MKNYAFVSFVKKISYPSIFFLLVLTPQRLLKKLYICGCMLNIHEVGKKLI